MTKDEPIDRQDSELKKHEEKCNQRYIEIIEKLASKVGRPTTYQFTISFIILLTFVIGGVGGSIWAISSPISGLRERIAVVETGIENLKDNQLMLSGQIAQLDGKIDKIDGKTDELIKQAQHDINKSTRHVLSSE